MAWKPIPFTEEDRHATAFLLRRKVRILVDEDLGPQVAVDLRKKGYDAVYAKEVRLGHRDDKDVAAFAWRKKRMLWTNDRDYLDDRIVPEHRNPGIVVLPKAGGRETLARAIEIAMAVFGRGPELWQKAKITISPGGYMTIRQREFDTGRIATTRFRRSERGIWEIWDEN